MVIKATFHRCSTCQNKWNCVNRILSFIEKPTNFSSIQFNYFKISVVLTPKIIKKNLLFFHIFNLTLRITGWQRSAVELPVRVDAVV